MDLKISTKILQDMVSKAIKGACNEKMIPITSLIGIELKNKILTLMTTDGSNHLRIKQSIELDPMYGPCDTQTFYATINADTFAKLIAKTTSENITLTILDNYLEVKGNGVYKLDLAVDEDNHVIKFNDIEIDTNSIANKLNINILKESLTKLAVSVAQTMEIPFLTGYYLSSNSMTTNREMMSCVANNLLEMPILISSEFANLLQLLEGDTVNLFIDQNKLLFETDKITIYGKQLEGIENYPISALTNLMNLDYNSYVKLDKQELLNILDRMSLFVNDYDKNGVYISFIEDKVQITSQKSNANELISAEYDKSKEFLPFRCLIDIEMFKSQIQISSNNFVEIYYGQSKSIKIKDNDNIIVICLLHDEQEEITNK